MEKDPQQPPVPSYFKTSIKDLSSLAEEGKTLPPLQRLFGNYILENSLVHFPSERGTGKSFFMLQVCIAVSSCWDSFCNERIEKYGPSLYINCELSEDVFARRASKLYENLPNPIPTSKGHPVRILTTRQSIMAIKKEVESEIHTLKPTLVVLDNWTIAFRDNDKSGREETSKFLVELLNLKDQYKFSLIIIDHTRKGTKFQLTDSDLQSGSGTKSDLADSDFFLRKSGQNPSFRLLKRVKSRNSEEQVNSKLLSFDPATLWFRCEEEEVNEVEHLQVNQSSPIDDKLEVAALLMKEKNYTYQRAAESVGIPQTTLYNRLKKENKT